MNLTIFFRNNNETSSIPHNSPKVLFPILYPHNYKIPLILGNSPRIGNTAIRLGSIH